MIDLALCPQTHHPPVTDHQPGKMSEVNIPKRKEKCENCTKQVKYWISIAVVVVL